MDSVLGWAEPGIKCCLGGRGQLGWVEPRLRMRPGIGWYLGGWRQVWDGV